MTVKPIYARCRGNGNAFAIYLEVDSLEHAREGAAEALEVALQLLEAVLDAPVHIRDQQDALIGQFARLGGGETPFEVHERRPQGLLAGKWRKHELIRFPA